MFAIIAANHYSYSIDDKTQTQSKKENFGIFHLVAPVCSQNQGIEGEIIKNNTNRYCFKGTSRLGIELIRNDQIEKHVEYSKFERYSETKEIRNPNFEEAKRKK
ncbi:hypothetical protein CR513_33305, partial [Mucuna pruriens]